MSPSCDEVLRLLTRGLIFFTFVVIAVAVFLPSNQAIYALFAGILGHFSGGLMMYLHIQKPPNDPPGGTPA